MTITANSNTTTRRKAIPLTRDQIAAIGTSLPQSERAVIWPGVHHPGNVSNGMNTRVLVTYDQAAAGWPTDSEVRAGNLPAGFEGKGGWWATARDLRAHLTEADLEREPMTGLLAEVWEPTVGGKFMIEGHSGVWDGGPYTASSVTPNNVEGRKDNDTSGLGSGTFNRRFIKEYVPTTYEVGDQVMVADHGAQAWNGPATITTRETHGMVELRRDHGTDQTTIGTIGTEYLTLVSKAGTATASEPLPAGTRLRLINDAQKNARNGSEVTLRVAYEPGHEPDYVDVIWDMSKCTFENTRVGAQSDGRYRRSDFEVMDTPSVPTATGLPRTIEVDGKTLTLKVLSTNYPASLRPHIGGPGSGTPRSTEAFWTSDNIEDRMFYVDNGAGGEQPRLVVPTSDPRSRGMRPVRGYEPQYGSGYLVWSINASNLDEVPSSYFETPVAEPEPVKPGLPRTIEIGGRTLTLGLIDLDYSTGERPGAYGVGTHGCWTSSNDEDRMFYVDFDAPDRYDLPLAVLPPSDPRSAGMREPGGGRENAFRDVSQGLKVWSITQQNVTEVPEGHPVFGTPEPVVMNEVPTVPGEGTREAEFEHNTRVYIPEGATWNAGSRSPVADAYQGKFGEIVSAVVDGDGDYYVRVEGTDNGHTHVGREWLRSVDSDNRIAGMPVEGATVDSKDETIARLQREISEAKQTHEKDIATIGEVLRAEAERRSWCSEYDEIVDDLNPQITVKIEERTREMEAYVDVTVRVRIEQTLRDSGVFRDMIQDGRLNDEIEEALTDSDAERISARVYTVNNT